MEIVCDKITPEVLKEAISEEYGVPVEEIKIEKIVLKPGSKKGDGFSSDIAAVQFQAIFNGETLDKNYIAKYAPNGNRGEVLKMMRAYEQESRAYTWLIPSLQKTRKEKSLKPLAFPKCLYSSVDDSILILENMKEQNFQVVEKKPEPLTLNAVKMVLQELAAFHASGHHFIKNYPGGIDALAKEYPLTFTEDFFNGNEMGEVMAKQFFDMTVNMFGSTVLVCKKYGTEELAEKMTEYHKKVKDVMAAMFTNKWKMGFVTHGDAWYNNFLYRYSNKDSEDPTEVSIVDLQNTRLGRPGIELAYFFCSSTSPDQRREHFDELFKFYYDQFFDQLKNLGDTSEPCFTIKELMDDYDDCYAFGFIMGCMHSQILLVNEESTSSFNMDTFGDEEATIRMMEAMELEFLSKADKSPDYRKLVIGLAQEAAQRNVI